MIKRLTADDIKLFREIREEAMRTNPESFGSPEEEQGGKRQDATYREGLKNEIWGIFEDENLAGVAGFYISSTKESQSCGQIFSLYVRSAYRGKGIGDRLLKHILALAENRVDQVHLCVVHTAEAAIKTCMKNGFEICYTDPHAFRVGDMDYNEHLMVKRLR